MIRETEESENANQGISETFECQTPGTIGAWRMVAIRSVTEYPRTGEENEKVIERIRRKGVQMKKFIHETGRIKMEDEHMGKLTVSFLISQTSDRI